MADALANLPATLALGEEEDMTILVCVKWVATSSDDKFVLEVSAVSIYEVEKED